MFFLWPEGLTGPQLPVFPDLRCLEDRWGVRTWVPAVAVGVMGRANVCRPPVHTRRALRGSVTLGGLVVSQGGVRRPTPAPRTPVVQKPVVPPRPLADSGLLSFVDESPDVVIQVGKIKLPNRNAHSHLRNKNRILEHSFPHSRTP